MVPEWKWTLNKLDFDEYFGVVRRTLGVIGAIFTIWIFVETRQKPSEKETTNELIGDMNLQLENLNVRVEEVRKSLLHLSCLYDAVQVQTKTKIVSKNCLQFIQQYQHAATYAPQLANPSRLVMVRQNKKQSSSPTLIGWLGHNQ